MAYKLKIPANVKFTIDSNENQNLSLMTNTLNERPDVLNDPEIGFKYKTEFQEYEPQIEYHSDTQELFITNIKEELNDPCHFQEHRILLPNSAGNPHNVQFNNQTYLFQTGIIIVKYHRAPRNNNKRRIKKLVPWQNDGNKLRPYGAAVCWGGIPFNNGFLKTRINVSLSSFTAEKVKVRGFEDVLNFIHPKQKEIDKEHKLNYYIGIIFRIRDPYRNTYITTKPSFTCIRRPIEITDANENPTYYFTPWSEN